MARFERLRAILREIATRAREHRPLGLGAQIAFYLMLAFYPFLLVGTAALAYLPLQDQAQRITREVLDIVPGEAGERIREMVVDVFSHRRPSLFSISALLLLWTGSSGSKAIMDAVVRVRGLRETRRWLHVRGLAVLATLGTIFLATVGGVLVGGASRWLRPAVEDEIPPFFIRAPEILAGGLLIVVAVQLAYYLGVPRKERPSFARALPGAVVAVLLWIAAGKGLALYVQNVRDLHAVYGPLGAFLGIMLFFYVGGVALVLGAELNAWLDGAGSATPGKPRSWRAARIFRSARGPAPAP
jgi:membrane protein